MVDGVGPEEGMQMLRVGLKESSCETLLQETRGKTGGEEWGAWGKWDSQAPGHPQRHKARGLCFSQVRTSEGSPWDPNDRGTYILS